MTLTIARGHFMDGRRSRTIEAELVLQGDRFRLRGGEHDLGTLADTRIDARLSSLPRNIDFPDGARFETLDHDVVDTWLRAQRGAAGSLGAQLHRLEGSLPMVAALLALVVAGIGWLLWFGIPLAAGVVAERLDPEIVERLSGNVLAQLDEGVLAPSRLGIDRRGGIRDRFAMAVEQLPQAPEYRLVFRRGMLNALALPDGTVVLTDELIEFTEDDDEIIGVLLHELGHIDRRHALRQVLQGSAASLLWLLVTGDVSSTSVLAAMPAALAQLSYSRALEREADEWAVRSMQQLDLDPGALADFLERLGERTDERPPAWLSTHPDPNARAQRLREAALP